jgi:hypothetical protein
MALPRPGTTGPYGATLYARNIPTGARQQSLARLESFAQAPYTTQFEGEAGRIGGLEALAGERETMALGGQAEALTRAQRAARGEGPSAAEWQQRRGLEQAERAGMAGAAEARGPGAGLAGRTAQYAGTQQAQEAIGQAAQLRAQEQLAAMGQEQALASQMRGQALQAGLGYGRLGLGTREATAQEQLAQTQQRLQAEQLMEQGRRGRMEGVKTAIGGVGTFMSSLMGGMSDVQAKQAPSQPPPEERKFDWQKFGQMLAMEEPREEPQQTGGLGALAGGLTASRSSPTSTRSKRTRRGCDVDVAICLLESRRSSASWSRWTPCRTSTRPTQARRAWDSRRRTWRRRPRVQRQCRRGRTVCGESTQARPA